MKQEMTLNEIGLKYNSDKSSTYHCYLELYDKYFSEYRSKDIKLLEIGILFGDSLKIFNEYFKNAKITAIDIEDKTHLKEDNIDIIIGSQADRELLNSFSDNYFNIILDDGSHKMSHQQISLGVLFKKLKSGGIYVVEDLHTSFSEYRENIIYGNKLFEIEENNRTVDFINGFKNGKKNNSYLSKEEYSYLLENIESVEIFETSRKNDNEFSVTSIIKKK